VTQGRYLYSTVRVVPSPATGEFANIAVIAGSDESGQWSLRLLPDQGRARQFCGPDAISAAHDVLAQLGSMIDLHDWIVEGGGEADEDPDLVQADEVSERWLQDLYERSHRVVQFSPPAPVLADNVDAALDLVFPRVTVAPERRAHQRLTKWRLLSDLLRSYLSVGLKPSDFYHHRATLVAGGPKRFTYPIDFVVANGSAVQLVQTWSFQVSRQSDLARDVKAWGWTVKEFQDHGGAVTTPDRTLNVPSDVDIQVVVAPPESDQASAVYEEASGVFEELNVAVREHGTEREVADLAARLLAEAQGRRFPR
jgi:hypothetical protein